MSDSYLDFLRMAGNRLETPREMFWEDVENWAATELRRGLS
jgi:hypothetical protein